MRGFVTANVLGMLPLTYAYNHLGSAFTVGTGTSLALGAALVAAFFLLPRWIERRDPFSLRRHFDHLS